MNAYVWHEHIPVINPYDPQRLACLLLPAGVDCPPAVTPDNIEQLYPMGTDINHVRFLGASMYYVAPKGVDPRDYGYRGTWLTE